MQLHLKQCEQLHLKPCEQLHLKAISDGYWLANAFKSAHDAEESFTRAKGKMGRTENKGTLEDRKHVTAALLRQASVSHLENVGRQVRRVDDALQLRFNGCLPRSVILLEACKFAHNATGNLMVDFV
jgi:hypothetical protein